MPFEVVLVNCVVCPSASQVLLSCAGHHLAHDTLILNNFTLVNYFWFSSFITTVEEPFDTVGSENFGLMYLAKEVWRVFYIFVSCFFSFKCVSNH